MCVRGYTSYVRYTSSDVACQVLGEEETYIVLIQKKSTLYLVSSQNTYNYNYNDTQFM